VVGAEEWSSSHCNPSASASPISPSPLRRGSGQDRIALDSNQTREPGNLSHRSATRPGLSGSCLSSLMLIQVSLFTHPAQSV